ncbi:acyl-CoA dehydrogenase family protein [Dokdonella sp.]|uniref:acyl-CoA dehydrogenase family protein n=1 Tax=Dokdonella sp. TaxID=2291710 RepID=UPI003528FEDA
MLDPGRRSRHCRACAEAFGALDRILKATIEYSRSRKQFGMPIGSFQALQHRMADMLMQFEQARSMMYLATESCNDSNAGARRRQSEPRR